MAINLNELRKRICEKQDLFLFDEAVKCFKSKALRMAYIAIWICVAESLRNKISIIAQRDKVADDVLREIEKVESRHMSPDRFILDKSKELGILDDSAFLQLEHLLAMRNIYAHPYNIGPILQEAELAFIQASDKVLSAPALLRKPYIDKLFENLSNNRHFIDNLEEKVIQFAQDVTGKIIPVLYPYMLKGLLYRLDTVVRDPDKAIFKDRIVWFTRALVNQIKPNFTEPEWKLKEKFDDFPMAVTLIFSNISLWELIPEDIQDGILGWLLEPVEIVDGKSVILVSSRESVQQALLLFKKGKLTTRQQERFLGWIEAEELSFLTLWSIPLELYVDKVINKLSIHNWYVDQNPAASCLWNIGPVGMKSTPIEKLEVLGRNLFQAADGNSHDSIAFLKNSIAQGIKWPSDFSRGILLEAFVNEDLKFRCKHEYIDDAILIAVRSSQGTSIELFNDLLQKIIGSTPKYGDDVFHGEKEAIEKINLVIAQLTQDELTTYQKVLLEIRKNLEDRINR